MSRPATGRTGRPAAARLGRPAAARLGRPAAVLALTALLAAGCSSAPTPQEELAARVDAATRQANDRDPDGLRDAAESLADTVSAQRDAQQLPAEQAKQLLALAADLRAGADEIDPDVQARRAAEREAEQARERAAAAEAARTKAEQQAAEQARQAERDAARRAAESRARDEDKDEDSKKDDDKKGDDKKDDDKKDDDD